MDLDKALTEAIVETLHDEYGIYNHAKTEFLYHRLDSLLEESKKAIGEILATEVSTYISNKEAI